MMTARRFWARARFSLGFFAIALMTAACASSGEEAEKEEPGPPTLVAVETVLGVPFICENDSCRAEILTFPLEDGPAKTGEAELDPGIPYFAANGDAFWLIPFGGSQSGGVPASPHIRFEVDTDGSKLSAVLDPRARGTVRGRGYRLHVVKEAILIPGKPTAPATPEDDDPDIYKDPEESVEAPASEAKQAADASAPKKALPPRLFSGGAKIMVGQRWRRNRNRTASP